MSLRTRGQLRAARALLGWPQDRLASEAGVSSATIKRLEPGEGALQVRLETLERLERALQHAGIQFIAENGGGPGVRLKAAAEPPRG